MIWGYHHFRFNLHMFIYLHYSSCVRIRMGAPKKPILRRSASVGILPWWLQHGPRLQLSLPRSRIMAVSPPDFWSFSSWFQFLHSPPFPPKIKKKRNARKFGWNSGRMGLQEYFVGDGFFSIPTCQNPKAKGCCETTCGPTSEWCDSCDQRHQRHKLHRSHHHWRGVLDSENLPPAWEVGCTLELWTQNYETF